MNKTLSLWLLTIFFLTTVSPTAAQQAKKLYRVGYLSGVDPATDALRSEGIRRALRELGYVEGQNIAFEFRHAEGTSERQAELAAELVRLKVDLILVAGGDGGVRAAMNATKTIPIVLTGFGSDPVKAGFVQSLARPGSNVTGLTSLARELGGKRLEVFKEAIPKLVRVAVLYQPSVPGTAREVKEDLPVAARALGLTVQPWEVWDAESFDKLFAALNKDRPDAVLETISGPIRTAQRKELAELAVKHRLPVMRERPEQVEAGGLMSYGVSLPALDRRAATYVDKILKGAKPADLSVEQPMKCEFIDNLKAAKAIGLTVPPNVLVRANRVIR